VTVASLNRNDRLLQAMWLLGEADRSLFITGRAGTGKSTLLSRFCEVTRRSRWCWRRPRDRSKGLIPRGLVVGAPMCTDRQTFSGAVIVFRAKRADRIKLLVWDGSGLVLVWKQLQQGVFRWPPVMDGVMRLSAVEFAALFDGLDWTRVQTIRRVPAPTTAA